MKFFITIFFLSFMSVGFGDFAEVVEKRDYLHKNAKEQAKAMYLRLVSGDEEEFFRLMEAEELVKIVKEYRKYFVEDVTMKKRLVDAAWDISIWQEEEPVEIINRYRKYFVRIVIMKKHRWKMGKAGLALLEILAEDEDVGVRMDVAYAAGAIGNAIGEVDLLQKLLRDPNDGVKRVALAKYAQVVGGERGVGFLVTIFKDENAVVRKAVASAAGIIVRDGKEVPFVTRAAFALLVELLKDKDVEVKSEARSALSWKLLSGRRAFEELLRGKNDKVQKMVNDEMRNNAPSNNCRELLR